MANLPIKICDGELYSEKLDFHEIQSIVSDTKNFDQKSKLTFVIFDWICEDNDKLTFLERYNHLMKCFEHTDFLHLQLVPTYKVESLEEIDEYLEKFIEEGYEGLMIRSTTGLYTQRRSTELIKYKKFIDQEFKIIGFEEGKGLDKDCVIWVCETKCGKKFSCRPDGSKQNRKDLLKNAEKYIGKMLTVKFQEFTNKNVPRFPVGKCIRDDLDYIHFI